MHLSGGASDNTMGSMSPPSLRSSGIALLSAFGLSAISAAAEEINFVSYNLKNYLRMDRRVAGEFKRDAPKPENEIKELIEIIVATKPDILGVCEMGGPDQFEDFVRRLAAAGLKYPHAELTLPADRTRHLALLSRFPIVARNSKTDLTYRLGDRELPFQRGILDVTVQVNDGYQLRCLGVHLKSKREVEEADQALMRRSEAELLRAHIDSIFEAIPGVNLVVYGDFNDTRNELPIKVVRGKFGRPEALTDIQLADDRGERWTYYWRWADQYSRFDFVFASRGLMPEVITDKSYIHTDPDWFTASDHRPLVLRVEATEREVK